MAERIIATLHATLADGTEATQGQTVDLSPEDEQSLEAQGALVPEVFGSFAEYSTFKIDAYRAGRGDAEAAVRLTQSTLQGKTDARAAELLAQAAEGGIEDIDTPGTGYVGLLREQSPGVDETVALAEGDPAKAREVLEAENVVTGQAPRKGVVEGLEKIIGQE